MNSKDILSQINRDSGMTVPDGYFEQFAADMAKALPPQSWESESPSIMPRSFWTRVRPYVYMAAMFLGIWCMMKTFDLMRPSATGSVEKNAQLMSALNNEAFFNDYCTPALNETDIIDELYEENFDPESMESLD